MPSLLSRLRHASARRPWAGSAAALLLALSPARGAVYIELPTDTEQGKIEFTQDVTFTAPYDMFTWRMYFQHWGPVWQPGDDPTTDAISGAAMSAPLAFTLNGAPLSVSVDQIVEGFAHYMPVAGPDPSVQVPLRDGGFEFSSNYILLNAGDVLVLKAGTYYLAAGSAPAGFDRRISQTFTGNVFFNLPDYFSPQPGSDIPVSPEFMASVGGIPAPPVPVIDFASLLESGLATSAAQDQSLISTMQGLLGDVNSHLFALHSGSTANADTVDEGVVMGEGDGDCGRGTAGPIAFKKPRSQRWQVFTTTNYANVSLSSIGAQNGVHSRSWSPGIGIERRVGQRLTLGFATSLVDTHLAYSASAGTLDMTGIALSTYASYSTRSAWVDLLYSHGRMDISTERHPAGFPTATGETTALTNAVQLNGGWRFHVPAWGLMHGPFAGLDWLHAGVDGYTENGGGLAALSYARRSFDSLVTRVGWSASRSFESNWARITPQLRLSYERQNIDRNNGTSATLVNLPLSATSNAQAPGQSYLAVSSGVSFQFTDRFSMLLSYSGQLLRQDMQAHFGSVRFSYQF